MLQEFLNQNFISITEDPNVEKLKKAAEDVVKKLNKNRQYIITYALIAFDPHIEVNNPIIKEVQEIIIKYWPTFNANSKDTPVTYIRAVILEALQEISKDLNIACIIWLTVRNVIKYYTLGREIDILTEFFLSLRKKVNDSAINDWSNFKDEKDNLTELSEPLNKDEVKNNFNWVSQNLLNTKQNIGIIHRFTQLLWWKESCYSPTFNSSYRDLTSPKLLLALAIDYSEIIPPIYPSNADYFLVEFYINIAPDDKKIKLFDLIKSIDDSKTEFSKVFGEYSIEVGRITFLNFIKGLIGEKYNIKQFKELVGIKSSIEITSSDFILWLFHDMQSQKIIKTK
jgi:hypothetical protein